MAFAEAAAARAGFKQRVPAAVFAFFNPFSQQNHIRFHTLFRLFDDFYSLFMLFYAFASIWRLKTPVPPLSVIDLMDAADAFFKTASAFLYSGATTLIL